MKHVLHIHTENRFTWIQLSDSGDILAAQEINHLAVLGTINPNDDWTILIPGQHVLISTVNLPKTNRRELQKAIPYALEENLISDIDKLSFVIGDYDAQGGVSVGVIDKKIIENYLKLLKSYQVYPRIMLPDFLAIPYVENRWSVLINDEMALVRTGKQCGFTTYHNNIRLLLQLTLEKFKEKLPEKINVYNVSKFNRKNMQVANHQVAIENISTKNPFVYLPTIQSPPLNLLQNQYLPKVKFPQKKRSWIYTSIISVTWLTVYFASKTFIGYHLHAHLNHLHTAIIQSYHQVFPQRTIPNNLRIPIEHELHALQDMTHGNPFIHLLSQVATDLHRYPMIHLQALAFANNQLSLKITTDNLNHLGLLTKTLSEQGLEVKQNQMNSEDKKISAELVIK